MRVTNNSKLLPLLMEDYQRLNNTGDKKPANFPAANFFEDDKVYSICLAIPGFKNEDFTITVAANILNVQCERKEPVVNIRQCHLREFSYTSFCRSFPLPPSTKPDAIEATYEAGVLTINIPKIQPANKAIKTIIVE